VARFFAALALASMAACGRGTVAPAAGQHYPDAPVILISIDTLRADHLPLYGYRGGSTPTLDRLGREGIVFEDVYSHCPLTLPSHASLLTGTLPVHHGVRDNIGYAVRADERTLAVRFKAGGYATGAAVSAFVLRHQTGIGRGFDFFDDRIEMAGTGESLSDTQRDGAKTVDALAAWIDGREGGRIFAFLHLYEPHTPYSPPPSHQMANPYDGEIAYADELVGRLLDRLAARRLLDRAIVAVVSDHGEGLNDHGEAEHGIFLYREALHVPWILRLPGAAGAGTRVAGTVGEVDVAATLLDLAGVDASGIDGASAASLLAGRPLGDRTVYSETLYPRLHFGWADLASATDGRHHFIRAPRPELFDLAVDPGERTNIAGEKKSTAAALDAWIDRVAAGTDVAAPAQVAPEVRERLKSLGYIGSSAPGSKNDRPLDPKDGIAQFEQLKRADALASSGRDAEAIGEFRRLTAANPRMLDAWESLAKSLIRTGRTAEGMAAFGEVLELDPLKPETHLALARIFALERQPARAREHAELAEKRDPAAASEILAELAMDAGRTADAKRYAERSVALDPSRYMASFLIGEAARREGRCDQAVDGYRKAIDAKQIDPHAVVRNLHAGLADCLARTGREADAEREFNEELSSIPSSVEARTGLAMLYRSQGRDADARRILAGIITAAERPDADAYWTVVHTFAVLGDASASREWKLKAREKFPRDARFRN
jgi:choline-sulfatase